MTPAIESDVEIGLQIAELLDRMSREEEALLDKGLCSLPGCGRVISTKRRKRYCDARHRSQRHKQRLEAVAKLRGVETHPSLRTLQAGNPPPERRGDAQNGRNAPQRRRKPRPGVSVYFPTVADAELALEGGLTDDVITAIERALERRRRRDSSPDDHNRPQEGTA